MTLLEALKDWLSSKDGQSMKNTMERRNIPISQLSPSSLPSRYNHVKTEGAYVRKGRFARTVGEYKEMYK